MNLPFWSWDLDCLIIGRDGHNDVQYLFGCARHLSNMMTEGKGSGVTRDGERTLVRSEGISGERDQEI